MTSCPYEALPAHAWWRKSVADTAPHAVAPFSEKPFRIGPEDWVATAGSCFAQEIGRRLPGLGLRYLVTEPGPERLSAEEQRSRQYGLFTARYGNIYTTAQLRQTLERAFGLFKPAEDCWVEPNGRFTDPFRPSVEPGGFSSREELEWSRDEHLASVRAMVERASVLVFTLGLTESWRSKVDGAVFPVCPGCGFGRFDASRHEFHNMRLGEVLADLDAVHRLLKERNPALRLLLTVSPVPLVATMSGQHVLAATAYSKSVLRVAAGDFVAGKDDCCYFPSFEIVTGPQSRGAYFHENLRTVSRHGVDHVMRCFAQMFVDAASPPGPAAAVGDENDAERGDRDRAAREALVTRVICDEEALQERYAAGRR